MSDAPSDDNERDDDDGQPFGDDGPELLAAPVVAAIFGRCPRTLRNWERRRLLTSRLIAGRRYYLRTQIKALISGRDI